MTATWKGEIGGLTIVYPDHIHLTEMGLESFYDIRHGFPHRHLKEELTFFNLTSHDPANAHKELSSHFDLSKALQTRSEPISHKLYTNIMMNMQPDDLFLQGHIPAITAAHPLESYNHKSDNAYYLTGAVCNIQDLISGTAAVLPYSPELVPVTTDLLMLDAIRGQISALANSALNTSLQIHADMEEE